MFNGRFLGHYFDYNFNWIAWIHVTPSGHAPYFRLLQRRTDMRLFGLLLFCFSIFVWLPGCKGLGIQSGHRLKTSPNKRNRNRGIYIKMHVNHERSKILSVHGEVLRLYFIHYHFKLINSYDKRRISFSSGKCCWQEFYNLDYIVLYIPSDLPTPHFWNF